MPARPHVWSLTLALALALPGLASAQIRVAVEDGSANGTGQEIADQLNDDTWFDFTATVVTADEIDSDQELANYDVVVMGQSGGYLDYDWTEDMAQAISDWVFNGNGGVVGAGWIDYAITDSSPGAEQLDEVLPIDAYPDGSNYLCYGNLTLVVTDDTHDVTLGLSDFTTTSEYIEINPLPLEAANALTLGEASGDSCNGTPTQAVAVGEWGQGNIAYLGLLYGASAGYNNTDLRSGAADQLLEQAVQWASQGVCPDIDGDGYGDDACGGLDCDDDDAAINPGEAEVLNEIDDDCDLMVDEGLLIEGDLLITEIMRDPLAVDDTFGEWVEVYNNSAYEVNLYGFEVTDLGSNAFTVDSDVWVSPDSYLILARHGDLGANGGVLADFVWSNYSLSNTEDEVILTFGGVEIDAVEYWDPDWPDVAGSAMSLDFDAYDATLNDEFENWCAGNAPFGDGDLGSPGDDNPICCPDADGDGYLFDNCGGDDCDDDDPDINPGADEVCDLVDNDCDGTVDEGDAIDAVIWYEDMDGDGYGNLDVTWVACFPPNGYVDNPDDCDDTDDQTYPGAPEACDNVDNDCDGEIDEELAELEWYPDVDGDGFGDANAAVILDCELIADHVNNAFDCDDSLAAINPTADEYCDGVDNDCDGEVDEPDALDADVYFLDLDGDGFGDPAAAVEGCTQPPNTAVNNDDCDDDDPDQHPGADEYCNNEDDDCDGVSDEDDALDALTWYLDDDGDFFGDPGQPTQACNEPTGYTDNDGDCDDTDAQVNPLAPEYCDGIDNDCDGTTDEDNAVDAPTWYADADGDGFGYPATWVAACDQPQGFAATGDDCNDTDADVFPGADEYCNGVDDDCDGTVDEDDALDVITWHLDADGDGYGDPTLSVTSCDPPPSFVEDGSDCDDSDAAQYPGADEYCNGEDDDCDGTVDEDEAVDADTWYEDLDGDGFGDPAVSDVSCEGDPGYVLDGSDCDDGDAAVNPDAEEVCNGIDDDCDASTDEVGDMDGDGWTLCDGDCDDFDEDVNPDAEEICDGGIDNDCDENTDENVDGDGDFFSICAGDCDDTEPAVNPAAVEICDGLDNDCDGSMPGDEVDGDGDGYLLCGDDCDDGDPATNPDATEQCDGLDNNCDGTVDEGVDVDGDGDGWNACQGDCDNADPDVYPGAPELCDGLDNDCDEATPEDEVDEDGDGYLVCDGDCDDTDASLTLDDLDYDGYTTCDGDCDDGDATLHLDDTDGDGWTTCDGDCDDGDPEVDPSDFDEDGVSSCEGDCDDEDDTVSPDLDEICDGVDNNCDGIIDEVDADSDGFVALDCQGNDCDDANPDIHPDAEEVCDDGEDNDCDGMVDDEDEDDCDDPGDDDTGDDDTGDDDTGDDDTGSDDDDDDTSLTDPDDCSCQNRIDRGPDASPLMALGLAVLVLVRRRVR